MKKSTTQPNQPKYASAGVGTLLLQEFIRVITRTNLVVWSRTDDGDELSGFSAALDTCDSRPHVGLPPVEIMVCPSERFRRGKGFTAIVTWFADDQDDGAATEMGAAIDAKIYAEVEESWRASGSLAQVNAKVAIICKGAAPTTRPYVASKVRRVGGNVLEMLARNDF
jgi:hypothetical protein